MAAASWSGATGRSSTPRSASTTGALAGPRSRADGDAVTIGAAKSPASATVWLVQYDPRQLDIPISAGENGGRTLPHRNIVRSLRALGSWSGSVARFAVPAGNPAFRRAVLVQRGKGGAIVAAAAI